MGMEAETVDSKIIIIIVIIVTKTIAIITIIILKINWIVPENNKERTKDYRLGKANIRSS